MTSEEILKNTGIYFGKDTINGITCSIGYIKEFRLSWVATQLNTFVIIGKAEGKIDKQTIESFSSSCFEYALQNHQGWPRGLQAGVASIAILQGNDIDNDAVTFCQHFSKKHWSAFEIPVLYDLDEKKTIRFLSKPIWGVMYISYLIKKIELVTSQFR